MKFSCICLGKNLKTVSINAYACHLKHTTYKIHANAAGNCSHCHCACHNAEFFLTGDQFQNTLNLNHLLGILGLGSWTCPSMICLQFRMRLKCTGCLIVTRIFNTCHWRASASLKNLCTTSLREFVDCLCITTLGAIIISAGWNWLMNIGTAIVVMGMKIMI